MIYQSTAINEWSKKYPELDVSDEECPECGHIIKFSKPYLSKDFAGVETEDCPNCGCIGGCRVFIPVSKTAMDMTAGISGLLWDVI